MGTPLPLAFDIADRLRLTPEGKIVDFVDPKVLRFNTPEERVRQNYARKLYYDYGYTKDRMVLGAPINIGSEVKFADIVIYRDSQSARRKDQAAIQIVVETKAPDVHKGEKQLQSYVFASCAEGGVWINDSDAPKYYRRFDQPELRLADWPNIPREGESWDGIGRHTKSQLRPPHDLVETFKRCHNALYKNGIDSEDLAMDMVRIILAKYRDEMNEGDTCEFRMNPLELQSAARRQQVAQRVRSLFEQVRDEHLDVFDKHEAITAGDKEITTVVSELQDFRFLQDDSSEDSYDVVGAAYEVYVGSHLKGDRGQYFTHRLIVQLLVKMVDPGDQAVILDPAMGSGGFLVASMRHVAQRIVASNRGQAAKAKALESLRHRIFGIDKGIKLVKVAKTNMILASDGHSGLVKGDSLDLLSKLPAEFTTKAGTGKPTVILTNPPFGATSEHKITPDKDPEILDQFEVGHAWKYDDRSQSMRPTATLIPEGVPPEYLFVERCIQWVAPGGKIGIILPRGILDNDKAYPLRLLILERTKVLAVVNCHDDTFKPYTDAKTAMLVLEKKQPGERDEGYTIFMAISQGIGHNGVGEPIYKTNSTGDLILVEGEPILDQDTDEIFKSWVAINRGEKSGSDYYYALNRRDIAVANLNLNPVRYLPKYTQSRQRVLEYGDRDDWTVEKLSQVAAVYNGPRFKRPYADKGVTSGHKIVRYFTGNAITQTRGENLKYLDLQKAKPNQLKMINKLYLRRGMVLITDSGTIGRVVYATAYHDGAVGTNNLIRVVIEDEMLRGYVYRFLSSRLGQDQLKANIYGAIVEHIEPDDVKNIFIPIPKRRHLLEAIASPVLRSFQEQENAYIDQEISKLELAEAGGFPNESDPRLAEQIHMRANGHAKASATAHTDVTLEFRALADKWRKDTAHMSSVSKMSAHPAYLRIIGMGAKALPLVFSELEAHRDHWLVALNAMTGDDPVEQGSDFPAAVDTWISWGRQKGYIH